MTHIRVLLFLKLGFRLKIKNKMYKIGKNWKKLKKKA